MSRKRTYRCLFQGFLATCKIHQLDHINYKFPRLLTHNSSFLIRNFSFWIQNSSVLLWPRSAFTFAWMKIAILNTKSIAFNAKFIDFEANRYLHSLLTRLLQLYNPSFWVEITGLWIISLCKIIIKSSWNHHKIIIKSSRFRTCLSRSSCSRSISEIWASRSCEIQHFQYKIRTFVEQNTNISIENQHFYLGRRALVVKFIIFSTKNSIKTA